MEVRGNHEQIVAPAVAMQAQHETGNQRIKPKYNMLISEACRMMGGQFDLPLDNSNNGDRIGNE